MKIEGLGVLHRVDYQRDDLEHSSQGKQASNHSQEDKHLRSTERKEGEDETDDQDDKATEEHGGRRSSPCVVHEALAAIVVGPAAAALTEASPPQRGRLDVVAGLQPAAAGQRDDVEGDGAEQEQGQDPPAALAGQAAAQHVDDRGAGQRSTRGTGGGESDPRALVPGQKGSGRGEAAPGRSPLGAGRGGAARGPHLDSGDSERAVCWP